jgi:hypothetical protein
MPALLSMWGDIQAPVVELLVAIDATSCSPGPNLHVCSETAPIKRAEVHAVP